MCREIAPIPRRVTRVCSVRMVSWYYVRVLFRIVVRILRHRGGRRLSFVVITAAAATATDDESQNTCCRRRRKATTVEWRCWLAGQSFHLTAIPHRQPHITAPLLLSSPSTTTSKTKETKRGRSCVPREWWCIGCAKCMHRRRQQQEATGANIFFP